MSNNVDKILELKKLLDNGNITQEDFENMKNELLQNVNNSKDTTMQTDTVSNKSMNLIYKWKKFFIASIILCIVTAIIKTLTNGIIWEIATIPLYISIILFVFSIISGWYAMHKSKEKWPIWYTIIIAIIIVAIISQIITHFIDKDNERRLSAMKEQTQIELDNYKNKYSSLINFDNPTSIANGEAIFRLNANEMNCHIKNMNVSYIASNNNHQYAFKGQVSISFGQNDSYSQMETWYGILVLKGNDNYSYEVSNSYDSAKLASGWNATNNTTSNKTEETNWDFSNGYDILLIKVNEHSQTSRAIYNSLNKYGKILDMVAEGEDEENEEWTIQLMVEKSKIEYAIKELSKIDWIDEVINSIDN